jgi:hypothetical protein
VDLIKNTPVFQGTAKSFYDTRDPIGFDINNGTIINNIEITDASSGYLKSKLQPILSNSKIVTFAEPLLNSGDYITIKFLVLHANNATPSLKSIGIISGISNIPIVNLYDESKNESIWKQIWNGNIGIYFLRFITYLFSFLLLAILFGLIIVIPVVYVLEFYNDMKRKKIAKRFKTNNEHIVNDSLLVIINKYCETGKEEIFTIFDLLKNKSKIEKILNQKDNHTRLKEIENEMHSINLQSNRNIKDIKQLSIEHDEIDLSLFLLNKKLIQHKNSKVIITDDIIDKLSIFVDYLKDKKL